MSKGFSLSSSPERDWPEDFEHENGQYFCRCIECKEEFTGHKRRSVCRVCANSGEYGMSNDKGSKEPIKDMPIVTTEQQVKFRERAIAIETELATARAENERIEQELSEYKAYTESIEYATTELQKQCLSEVRALKANSISSQIDAVRAFGDTLEGLYPDWSNHSQTIQQMAYTYAKSLSPQASEGDSDE